MTDILPNSMPHSRKIDTRISGHGINWIIIFCANCGKEGGRVMENCYDFSFYLCEPCAVKLGPIVNTYMEPDAVFWKRVNDAMEEKYGRLLTIPEQVEGLKDSDHILSKLAREHRKKT